MALLRHNQEPEFNRMRVSFDLDEVLFVNPENHKTEPALKYPLNKLYKEQLRLGTPRLVSELQKAGYEVWVYTSSFRSERYIRSLFGHYHVHFDGIVNGDRHMREVQSHSKEAMPTKMPNRYRISLHVDDEDIVVTYGKTYGFNVYQLDAQDDDWVEKILDRAKEVQRLEKLRNEASN